jgi:protein-tyrosine phosphatase
MTRLCVLLVVFGLPAFSVPGIHNFVQVNAQVYRGAQPTDEGFRYLAKIGVRTVLDLRESDARTVGERRSVLASGMQYVNVPMSGLTPPTDAEISKILALLEDGASGPVFFHCMRGADRTGAVIAAYRIQHDKWDSVQALKEARSRGMSFFQFPRQKFIRTFKPRPEATAMPIDAVSAVVAPAVQ